MLDRMSGSGADISPSLPGRRVACLFHGGRGGGDDPAPSPRPTAVPRPSSPPRSSSAVSTPRTARSPSGDFSLAALNVAERGAAHIVAFPGRAHADRRRKRASRERGASGIVLPFLRSRGIRRLDSLVLTHPHEDHYGGAGRRSFPRCRIARSGSGRIRGSAFGSRRSPPGSAIRDGPPPAAVRSR